MPCIRLIARLDIKGPNLIKGINLEGLRVLGDPNKFAQLYYEQGADELLYLDCVASLYNRESLIEIIRKTSESVFIPLTAGGGIRSVDDARAILRAGADKVAVNTAAMKRPELIRELSNEFGAQAVVLSVEAKTRGNGNWEAYVENGREKTGRDVVEWAQQAASLGAGEILLTAVDREGTFSGYDIALTRTVSAAVTIPVIASGGMGNTKHLTRIVKEGNANAAAIAGALHYNKFTLAQIRDACLAEGISVRKVATS